MYIRIYVRVNVYKYTYIHIYVYKYTYTCVCVCTFPMFPKHTHHRLISVAHCDMTVLPVLEKNAEEISRDWIFFPSTFM